MTAARLRDADTEAAALRRSPLASLEGGPISDEGRQLVMHLVPMLEQFEQAKGRRKNVRGKKAQDKLSKAVGAFLGNLLLAQVSGSSRGWVSRSLSAKSFSQSAVSARTFSSVRVAMGGLGLVEQKPGYRKFVDFGQGAIATKGHVSRFRATAKLLAVAKEYGVIIKQAEQHFTEGLPSRPLKLRAMSSRNEFGMKVRGADIPFTNTRMARKLEADVRELNEFLSRQKLDGGIHRGYVRIFNNGSHPKFKWNMGGRLYSVGEDSYQTLDKRQRLSMKINGEGVAEIDIRASFLTIFLASKDISIDKRCDPYEVSGLKGRHARDVVKSFFTATFGSNAQLKRWPRDTIRQYRELTGCNLSNDYPIGVIRSKVLERYPVLAEWGQPDRNGAGWEKLMWLESVAVTSSMLDLKREHDVPSYAVHDSLIVPKSKMKLAMKCLSARYEWVTQVRPHLTTSSK